MPKIEFRERKFIMKKQKKELTKEKIVRYITDKEIYDIDYNSAVKAVENIKFTKCYKYSEYHYKTIFAILKSKLDMMSDKDDKIAYLNCLRVNYTALSKPEVFAVIIGILTGDVVKVAFLEKSNDVICNLAIIILVIAFSCLTAYALTSRKWSFFDKLLEHLKDNI